MRASTVFALLASVAVSFAMPGTYTPAPTPAPAPTPDAADNPPAGAPAASPAASPAAAPAASPSGNCNVSQAQACCNGDVPAGGLLSALNLGACSLSILSSECGGGRSYCCNTNSGGLISLSSCGPLIGDLI